MSSPKTDGVGHYLRLFIQELGAEEPEGVRRGGAAAPEPVVLPEGDPYLERIAQECMACKGEVERIISPVARNPALVEDIVAQASMRVVVHADKHRDDKPVGSVKALLLVAARNLLKDAQGKKLKADKLPTVSWDDEANEWLMNRPDHSPVQGMSIRAEADRVKKLIASSATDQEKEMFRLWYEEDMNQAEIARRLGISSATVKTRMHRLFAKVRLALTGRA
jgi:RNA polymerase sigma factor (sigma-70 family)